jgi:DNA-binding NtrC family response regulator
MRSSASRASLVSADDAAALSRRGRHAAAERALRQLAGALVRRRAFAPASAALVRLGHLLVERGQSAAACRAFETAEVVARDARLVEARATAAIWLAASCADNGHLAEAEARCRDERHRADLPADLHRWASAVLGRICLWQGRIDEARAVLDACAPAVPADAHAVYVETTAVRVLVASGDLFGARQRLDALARGIGDADPVGRLLLDTAALRLACAAGDLEGAAATVTRIGREASAMHLPMRAIRAQVIWLQALRDAGQHAEAARLARRLGRLRRAVPPLLRGSIDAAAGARAGAMLHRLPGMVLGSRIAGLADLVETCRSEPSDVQALERACALLRTMLDAERVEVVPLVGQCRDSRAAPVRLSIGLGPPTSLARLVQTGEAAGPRPVPDGREEAGVAIRFGGVPIAALVARWRQAPVDAERWMSGAAAIVAGRVDGWMHALRAASAADSPVPGLLGRSPAMRAVREAVIRAAPAPFSVVVVGESGVGKELIARALHTLSPRRTHRFCDLNCAALPDELIEAELFGHARGAFTGAIAERAGLFEEANGGTVFLDEVVELSPRAQAKLLRVIQQQEVRRIGEARPRALDVRVVSAANRDPRDEAAAGAFRTDLVYRLDVIRIAVPPLRERPEDVPELADHFWRAAAGRVGSHATLAAEVQQLLAAHHWPGNVRELQNVLAAVAVSAPREGRVGVQHLPAHLRHAPVAGAPQRLEEARRESDRAAIRAALRRAGGHRAQAARELGLSRQGLLKLMCRLGMSDAPQT